MKKSTLLSLATVGTIVATSIGTFAAWDTLSVAEKGNVTITAPVTMSMNALSTFTSSREAGVLDADVAPTYTQDVTFEVASLPTDAEGKYKLEVTPVVYNKGTTTIATGITAGADKASSDINDKIEGSHTYTVTVTPTDQASATEYDVEVTAKIVPVTPAP